eukprot:753404-Hanusia_phi.AAC.11
MKVFTPVQQTRRTGRLQSRGGDVENLWAAHLRDKCLCKSGPCLQERDSPAWMLSLPHQQNRGGEEGGAARADSAEPRQASSEFSRRKPQSRDAQG